MRVETFRDYVCIVLKNINKQHIDLSDGITQVCLGLLQLYLQSFGYIDKKRTASDHQDIVDVTKAIKEFQSFAGLDVTGN